MVSWPELGARVSVRYQRPKGSVPPLTDAIGHLLKIAGNVDICTKSGEVVHIAADDVVAVRLLSDRPVRASEIRALEHADALAWPCTEHHWLGGWLLRAGPDDTLRSNSAVPLDMSADQSAIPGIVDWYRSRNRVPRLSVPDRLLRVPAEGEHANRLMVCDVQACAGAPDLPAGAVITDAPDGTRWVGLAWLRESDRRAGEAQLAWGASQNATRGYVRIPEADRDSTTVARSLGFALHHHSRYITLP